MNAFVIFGLFLSVGYLFGKLGESRHYRDIERRESELLQLPAITMKGGFDTARVERAELVCGNAVISIDYFKRVFAGLMNIVGGNLIGLETLIDRARREAQLRMKDQARGADLIVNTRIETSAIGGSAGDKNAIACVEVLAFGTAIWLKKT